jgi:hypothetical protein
MSLRSSNEKLLDSRKPSTSDIEASLRPSSGHSYHNCGSALPISFEFTGKH